MSKTQQRLNSLQAVDRIVIEVFGSFADPTDKFFIGPARMTVYNRASKKPEEERIRSLKRIQAILNLTL